MGEKNMSNIKITTQEEQQVREKSIENMPSNPSLKGWSPQEIRKALVSALLDDDLSVLSLIKNHFEKTIDMFDFMFENGTEGVEISSQELLLNKHTRLWIKDLDAIEEEEVIIYNILFGGFFNQKPSSKILGGTFDEKPANIVSGGVF